jgi:hypothetical protein
MRVAILAYGSRGDIQPMVVLGDEPRRRGHSVVLTVNENLAGWAGRCGVDVVPMKPDLGSFPGSDTAKDIMAGGKILKFTPSSGGPERTGHPALRLDGGGTAASLIITDPAGAGCPRARPGCGPLSSPQRSGAGVRLLAAAGLGTAEGAGRVRLLAGFRSGW